MNTVSTPKPPKEVSDHITHMDKKVFCSSCGLEMYLHTPMCPAKNPSETNEADYLKIFDEGYKDGWSAGYDSCLLEHDDDIDLERQRVVEMIEGKIKEAVEWGDHTGEEVKNILSDLQSKLEEK
jgi:hypothetical protein